MRYAACILAALVMLSIWMGANLALQPVTFHNGDVPPAQAWSRAFSPQQFREGKVLTVEQWQALCPAQHFTFGHVVTAAELNACERRYRARRLFR